jgi:hypothetical protein
MTDWPCICMVDNGDDDGLMERMVFVRTLAAVAHRGLKHVFPPFFPFLFFCTHSRYIRRGFARNLSLERYSLKGM